jgi:tetrahydromethanopterin S-methyltransferase subunit G
MTHQKMNEIKKQMDYMQNNGNNNQRAGKHIDGDFIDYEEIK